MNDRFVDASSSAIVRDAQRMILEFVEDYFDEEKQALVKNALKNCEIYFEKEEFFRTKRGSYDGIRRRPSVAAYTRADGTIILPEEYVDKQFLLTVGEDASSGYALNTIIHEYAHALSRTHSDSGYMFEEGFANTFAKACIINHRIRQQSINHDGTAPNTYGDGTYLYGKAEAQVASILYVLNQKGLDIQLIGEYIFGDRDVFKQKCIEVFGEEFESYFELANSNRDEYYNDYEDTEHNSEAKLVSLLANYIKNNGISLKNYRNFNHILLFNRDCRTLERAVVTAGREVINEEDIAMFESFKKGVEYDDKLVQQELDEIKSRVKNIVFQKYDLNGKSKKEIDRIVADICGEYHFRRASKSIDDRTFINEIKKLIPNLEEFVKKSVELNYFSVPAETIFADLDMEKVSFEGVSNCIFSTLEQFKQKELEKSIARKFNGCDNKEDLLTRIEELKEHEEKFDLEALLPNYGDFIKFVDELREQIPDTFSKETNWNYESLYGAFLKQYILKKEKDLADSRELEKECKRDLKRIQIQYKVLEHEDKFGDIKTNHDRLCLQLLESQQELEEEKRDKANNQDQNEELVKRKEELEKKNLITRLLKRREIRELSQKIAELGNAIHNNDINIEQIKSRIGALQGEIKDNEQQLIDLCGLRISDYALVLSKCKLDNVTQDKLTEDAIVIQNEINGLNIPQQEQELENLYEKNGLERKTEIVQQPIVRKRDDDEYCL